MSEMQELLMEQDAIANNYVRGTIRKYAHLDIAERALGKPLPKGAIVHHDNKLRYDNRNCNLVICESRGYHAILHYRMRAYEATGNGDALRCEICKKWSDDTDREDYYVLPGLPGPHCRARHRRCATLKRAKNMTEQAQNRLARNLCVQCGKARGQSTTQRYCQLCTKKRNTLRRELRLLRVAQGLCELCGARRGADGTNIKCSICATKIRTQQQKRRAAYPRKPQYVPTHEQARTMGFRSGEARRKKRDDLSRARGETK